MKTFRFYKQHDAMADTSDRRNACPVRPYLCSGSTILIILEVLCITDLG